MYPKHAQTNTEPNHHRPFTTTTTASAVFPPEKMTTGISRALGNTEQNWCRAVASGTGITVLALQMSKPPQEIISALTGILHSLQNRHPILAAKLHYNPTTKTYSFLTPATPKPHVIKFHDAPLTSSDVSPIQTILEHELNNADWSDPGSFPCKGTDVFLVTVYPLPDAKCVVVLRFHTSVCDRTTAVSLLRELMEMVAGGEGAKVGIENEGEGEMGIENMIPRGAGKKTVWAHGIDMLGYSVNSLRLTNLAFENTKMPRRTEVVRLHLNAKYTNLILEGCKSRGIKVCGALGAASLIAAHSDKIKKKKYGVVTFTDCRSTLQPSLSTHHYGFYSSAILNIHTVKGTDKLWELAKACYSDFLHYKSSNKHFSDMADLNFLMSKAIDNPSLTASSSLRTSLLAVFEDPVMDDSGHMQQAISVDDYMGCASIHGVGPSIGIFDTVRDGELDCVCVYPAPLHSREQMTELVGRMRRILITAGI